MLTTLMVRVLAVVLILLGIACTHATAQQKPVRRDVHGLALPDGAIARLGSSRLSHAGRIHMLIFSSDGGWLASAGADKVIRIWDADNGKALWNLEGHQDAVRCVAFVSEFRDSSPKMLISGSVDKTIRFWDLKTGKELKHCINHPGPVTTLAVSPDGKFLASGGSDSQIFLWQIEDGKEVRRWQAHRGGVNALAFLPNGKSLVSGGAAQPSPPGKADDAKDSYCAAIWDIETGKARHTISGHTTVWAIALSANGKQLATTGTDDTNGRPILLWDTKTGKAIRTVGTRGTNARFLAMTGDGKILAGPDFHRIAVWDADSAAPQRSFHSEDKAQVEALAYSPDGKTLASSRDDGRILLWDVAQRTQKLGDQGHTKPITSIVVSPDGKTMATTSEDGSAYLWDNVTSRPIRLFRGEKGVGIITWCATFSPDCRTIALSHRGAITWWNVKTGTFEQQPLGSNVPDDIGFVAYSTDGKWLAIDGLVQNHVSLQEATTGKPIRIFPRGTKKFGDRNSSVAISSDSRLLASAASDGLHVWEIDSGKVIFQVRQNFATSVAFSPGGFLLASAGEGVRVHEVFDGAELTTFKARLHRFGYRAIAFSPGGLLLAVAEVEGVKLWDVVNRRELRVFKGHRGEVMSVAFMPDGKALVSAAEDGNALIWDLEEMLPAQKARDAKSDWDDLMHKDRLRAYAAYCRLRASSKDAVQTLKKHMLPTPAVPAQRVEDLIKKLDSGNFQVRDQALQELQKLGLAAEKAILQARENKPALETKRRLDLLIAELNTGGEWRRAWTALKLLEEFRTPEARELLESLSKGNPDSRLTRQASEALQRIGKKQASAVP
jgi:WD40 repeat protein